MPSTNIESSRVFEVRGLKWSGGPLGVRGGTTGAHLGDHSGGQGGRLVRFLGTSPRWSSGHRIALPVFDVASSSRDELVLILHGI